ncbi:hypothetical protein CEXT_176721 [Caerostris extrusa]|uniref:Uncharacterized protein n=1 Tax=Caerostris extrusa TaxID=172846 RepID=A0AAV4Y4I6_CAEEX|nr:hypothetical protein CEXT_176721 [Caerostris extrusa]
MRSAARRVFSDPLKQSDTSMTLAKRQGQNRDWRKTHTHPCSEHGHAAREIAIGNGGFSNYENPSVTGNGVYKYENRFREDFLKLNTFIPITYFYH